MAQQSLAQLHGADPRSARVPLDWIQAMSSFDTVLRGLLPGDTSRFSRSTPSACLRCPRLLAPDLRRQG